MLGRTKYLTMFDDISTWKVKNHELSAQDRDINFNIKCNLCFGFCNQNCFVDDLFDEVNLIASSIFIDSMFTKYPNIFYMEYKYGN